jgi:hypothetical protein
LSSTTWDSSRLAINAESSTCFQVLVSGATSNHN